MSAWPVLAAVAVLGLAACASGERSAEGVAIAGDARFEEWDGDQEHARVALVDLDAVGERLAFDLVFPRDLPEGVELRSATVFLGPSVFEPDREREDSWADVWFSRADDPGGFSMSERLAGPGRAFGGPIGPNVRGVEIGGVGVTMNDRAPEPGLPRGFRTALWSACGLHFELGGSFSELSEAELFAIAESFIEACE